MNVLLCFTICLYENFLGDRYFATYIIAFGSLFWSLFLFVKLIKIEKMSYAIKYSILTVIIFWNFVMKNRQKE